MWLPVPSLLEMDKPDPKTAFEKVWAQALLAVNTAEDEAAKVVARAQELFGWSQEEVKRRAGELTERLAAQRKQLENSVDHYTSRALAQLHVPRRAELAELAARLDKVASRIDALEKR